MTTKPDIVLIVLDAMRKDVLPAYGGKVKTPNIDRFCRDAVVYGNAIAPSPWTIPSHASLFVGEYPVQHGVHETHDQKTSDIVGLMQKAQTKTLAEELKKNGYNTIGISANWMLSVHRGFDRGFNFFTSVEEGTTTEKEKQVIERITAQGGDVRKAVWRLLSRGRIRDMLELYSVYRNVNARKKLRNFPHVKGGDVVARTVRNAMSERPLFLFVNFLEMHDPYTRYEQVTANKGSFPSVQMADLFGYKKIPREKMDEIRSGYYSAASWLDEFFGELVAHLKKEGTYDKSLIIVTSDHGQALMEHGFYGHGTFLYDEIVEIPLIVKYPGNRLPSPGTGYQTLVDIPKLVTAQAGGVDAELESRSFVFSEAFGTQNRPPPAASGSELDSMIGSRRNDIDVPRRAIFLGGYKLVVRLTDQKIEELTFNKQSIDRSGKEDVVRQLMDELGRHELSRREVERPPDVQSPEEEAAIEERLRRLGYV